MSQENSIPRSVIAPADALVVESLSWKETWWLALTQPSVATYERIIRDPKATTSRGYNWVFVAALIGYVLFWLVQSMVGAIYGAGATEVLGAYEVFGVSLAGLICVTPVAALLAVLGLIIGAVVLHVCARILGGTGTYSKLVYAIAAYDAPMMLISLALGPIPTLNYANLLMSIYVVALQVIAVKAVHQFSWGKAIASVMLPLVILGAAVGACLMLTIIPLIFSAR